MVRYLLRRLGFAVLLVFVVASASLVLTRLAPGDFATEAFGLGANPRTVARARARYGLDEPILTQYGLWLAHAARLDFGTSLLYGRPVAQLIPQRAANTALLALAALLLATLVGLPLGVVSGSRPGPLATAIRLVSLLLLSMPPLVTSLLFVFVAARTGWFPIGGMSSLDVSGFGLVRDVLWHLTLPAVALALPVAAMFERLQSQAMAEALTQPFVLAARARGVPPGRLIWRDALRVAIRPCASVYGLVVGTLLSGSFIVEIVTAWPGLGRLMYDALRARDVYLVTGCAAAGALFLAAGSVISDLALAAADPRVRAQ
ncbi:MAG TPA: ABC transporter permease [Vicinamibacterales bacterium]|nr:ABC transporter permease [Vicinamibacterales bacterium]